MTIFCFAVYLHSWLVHALTTRIDLIHTTKSHPYTPLGKISSTFYPVLVTALLFVLYFRSICPSFHTPFMPVCVALSLSLNLSFIPFSRKSPFLSIVILFIILSCRCLCPPMFIRQVFIFSCPCSILCHFHVLALARRFFSCLCQFRCPNTCRSSFFRGSPSVLATLLTSFSCPSFFVVLSFFFSCSVSVSTVPWYFHFPCVCLVESQNRNYFVIKYIQRKVFYCVQY
jgi:hypothetical protein